MDKFMRRRFTLIEMLVVIAIIGILASMIMPALQRSMSQAYTVKCSNNLRQVSILLFKYMDDNQGFQPKPYLKVSNSPSQRHVWYQALYPYLGSAIPTSSNTSEFGIFICDILPDQSGLERGFGDYALTNYRNMNIYNDWVRPMSSARSPSKVAQFFDSAILKSWNWSGQTFYDCNLHGIFDSNRDEDKRAVDWRHGAQVFGPSGNNSLSKGYDGVANFTYLDGHVESRGNDLSLDESLEMQTLQ